MAPVVRVINPCGGVDDERDGGAASSRVLVLRAFRGDGGVVYAASGTGVGVLVGLEVGVVLAS